MVDRHERKQPVLTEQQRRALQTLSRLPDICTASQWQTESGIPESSFFRAIKTLQDFGYVETTDAGKNKGYTLSDKGRKALTLT